jgi:hypothetical protein
MNTKTRQAKDPIETFAASIESTAFKAKPAREMDLPAFQDFDLAALPSGFENCFTSAFFERKDALSERPVKTAIRQK